MLRSFTCRRCGQLVFCESVACLRCGAPPGVVPEARELATVGAVEPGATPGDAPAITASAGPAGARWPRCAAEVTADCNRLALAGPPALCRTCGLTRTRPADAAADGLAATLAAEGAERRVVFPLDEPGLPATRAEDSERGLAGAGR